MARQLDTFTSALCAALLFACSSSDGPAGAGAGGGTSLDGGSTSTGGSTSADGSTSTGGTVGTGDALALTSSVFQEGATVPGEYRCAVPSPDLAWSGGPPDAASYALVFRDVTPGISKGFFHWVLYDIPETVMALPKGVPVGYAPASPAGAHQAAIWNGTLGFNGPCGGNNTYELTLHAIDVPTLPGTSASSTAAQVLTAIEGHTLEKVTMTVMSKP